MGSDIEVLGGGAVAVDTDTLRITASRFVLAREDLEEILRRLGVLQNMLFGEWAHTGEALSAASVLSTRLRETFAGATRIAADLREAAAVYELVELNAEHRAAVFAGDRVAEARISAVRDALMAEHPDAFAASIGAEFERTVMWPGDLVRQATETGMTAGSEISERGAIIGGASLGLGAIAVAATAGFTGSGRLGPDARLTGRGEPVTLTAVVPTHTRASAPTSLAAVAQRMPGSGESRVRVERYTMPGGAVQYAVYVAGTRSLALGGEEPWDNLSNGQLYLGQSSASYEATVAALDAAGARPGDVVHAFGHSQGAMITAHLALEGGYDTRTHVTFGAPVEAEVGEGTLSVGIRHTDDPVAALAGGGHIAPVGAPGSFVVEREAHPASGFDDADLPAHQMVAYAETAALVDASADPRVDGVRAVFAELEGAVSVEVTEYAAARPGG